MITSFSKDSVKKLIDLQAQKGVLLEGAILNYIDAGEDIQLQNYIKKAKLKDKEVRKKRLKISEDLQKASLNLALKNEELQQRVAELDKIKIRLEKENGNVREYNLKMEELKANNTFKTNSMAMMIGFMGFIFVLILFLPALFSDYETPSGFITAFFGLAGILMTLLANISYEKNDKTTNKFNNRTNNINEREQERENVFKVNNKGR